jgi:two-component system OmpR family response regulator
VLYSLLQLWRKEMATVLVADDDRHIREVVRFALEKAGHRVMEAADGAAALEQVRNRPVDLVVLDIIMPEDDGLEVCRKLRQERRLPILFLSSRDEEVDRVLGLELGADDYVTKPFSPRELVARVKAVLRRSGVGGGEPDELRPVRRGPLTLDPTRHRCTWDSADVPLTATEFALLHSLMVTPGRVYSRNELVDKAWGYGHHITDRTVDSHVRRMRRKFDRVHADPIETVYGVGYRVRECDDVVA